MNKAYGLITDIDESHELLRGISKHYRTPRPVIIQLFVLSCAGGEVYEITFVKLSRTSAKNIIYIYMLYTRRR